jgi:HSP20 family protein
MLVPTDREFDRLTQHLLSTAARPTTMPMDAYRLEDTFCVHFDLPGVDPDRINLTVELNTLTVRAERPGPDEDKVEMVVAERPRGTLSRQLLLSNTLDPDRIEAEYDAGVLTLRIPVAQQAKPRRVQVTSSGTHDVINPERFPIPER